MTPIRPALLAFVFAVTALPAVADESATVTVRDTYGQLVTTLTLSDAGNGVLVTGTVSGIDPGPHAIHFHEKGVCEPPFETAGGHFNPTGHQHGILNAEGHHAGDMPNVVMPKEGEGTIQIFAAGVTLARDAEGSLRDGDGT
ncbi:MAG: superoxide dismutase family protein, partial [Rhizobiales bacterium]|nr:superoxide dismutase family protein [Hyphomicrobiales bacterium]